MDLDFAKELTARFSSPLYTYDLEVVDRQARFLKSILPDESQILYSLKSNPLPSICETLAKNGVYGEVSSTGELAVALDSGFLPENILYSGPGKSREEIQAALAAHIRYFSCESWVDFGRLGTIAEEMDKEVNVLIRFNPPVAPKAGLAMTGISSKFGFEPEDFISQLSKLHEFEHLHFVGIHTYFGTQIKTAEGLINTYSWTLDLAEKLAQRLGKSLEVINLGGGFAWPYCKDEEFESIEELRELLAQKQSSITYNDKAQWWFESGRFLSAASGTLLSKVVDIKYSKGRKYIILDTGVHHLGGMSGLGRLLFPKLSLLKLGNPAPNEETCEIVGPLCTPLDCIGKGVEVPKLAIDDLVAIPNVGAYGLTASLNNFLSRPIPKEVSHRAGRIVNVYSLQRGHQLLEIREKSF